VDEALAEMLMGDSQPFTAVEDKGLKKLVKALNLNYVLPTRQAHEAFSDIYQESSLFQALEAMVDDKYQKYKEKNPK